jgi:hypothetical protein
MLPDSVTPPSQTRSQLPSSPHVREPIYCLAENLGLHESDFADLNSNKSPLGDSRGTKRHGDDTSGIAMFGDDGYDVLFWNILLIVLSYRGV